MIIDRIQLIKRIQNSTKWIFIYGRRKTGKTFIVENSINYDNYFFVNRNRTILNKEDNSILLYETFIEILRISLKNGRTVVVDEFHRLGDNFLDVIHSINKTGKLILITSTLFLARNMLSSNSPIMGLFNEINVDLINLSETLKEVSKINFDKNCLLQNAIIAREPLAIDYINNTSSSIIRDVLIGSIHTVPALVGEIFNEEERTNTAIYSGILSAVSTGNISSGKISSFLFLRKLIQKDDSSVIQSHLTNLVKIGLLRKIHIYNKNKFAYKINSPLIRLYYYAEEKIGLSEHFNSTEKVDEIINVLFPKIVEDNVREFLSIKYGLIETIMEDADYDVDGYLLHFKKPEIALEVKWRKNIKDIKQIESKLLSVDAEKHILFVQDKTNLFSDKMMIIDVNDLLQ
jgi:hypothetical protein